MLRRGRGNSGNGNDTDNDGNSSYGSDNNDKSLDSPWQGITCQNLDTLRVVSLWCSLGGTELKFKTRLAIYQNITERIQWFTRIFKCML